MRYIYSILFITFFSNIKATYLDTLFSYGNKVKDIMCYSSKPTLCIEDGGIPSNFGYLEGESENLQNANALIENAHSDFFKQSEN